MTLGATLREARERSGVTLEEIFARTKIRVVALRAIENDDFRNLPRGIILRGFLKQFAREVGLDPDEMVERYAAEIGLDESGAQNAAADRNQPGLTVAPESSSRFTRALAGGAVALLALLAAGYLLTKPAPGSRSGLDGRNQPAPAAGAPSAGAASPAPLAPPPAPVEPTATTAGRAGESTAPSEPRAGGEDASADELRVDLRATAACWISATVDGQQVALRVLNAGERLGIRVKTEAVLRIGNPASLAVSINDMPIRPFERPGAPVTLRITPANFRDLLER